MKVAILGASSKPERYSHRAQLLLMDHGHEVIPVSPRAEKILGIPATGEVPIGVDTVTLYLSPERLLPILDQLIAAAPRRVIFNPGTESEEAAQRLRAADIACEEACTLVLLKTDSFAL